MSIKPRRYRTLAGVVVPGVLAMLAACTGPAIAQERSTKVLQQRPDRLIVQLPNRLIIIAQEIRTAPVVSAQVKVKTGSIYEQEHVGAGLSHFLEHLIAAGSTTTRTEKQSNAILGRIGGRTNAGTGLDTVTYYIDTTSDHTDTVIDLLSDWLINGQINQAEYEREREVIQREFESGRGDPGRIFWKLTQQARYQAHPARHPTIGYIDEFLAVTRDGIYDFYKRMYVPNNMIFIVAGDIDKQEVVDRITKIWSDVPDRPLPKVHLPVERSPEEPRELTGHADIRQPKLRVAWPGTRLAAPHDYALDLLGMALGQGEASRLVRSVRDERRLVDTISSYNVSFAWGEGFFGADADVRPLSAQESAGMTDHQAQAAAIERARAAILEQVDQVRAEGLTEQELDRAKRKVLADTLSAGQSAHALAGRIGGDMAHMGDPDYRHRYTEAIQQISNGQIIAAAVEYLDPQRSITVTLLPAPKDHAPQPLVRPADQVEVTELDSEQVVLDNAALVDQMMALRADQDKAVPAVEQGPIETFKGPNGLRLLVQRNTLVPSVSIQMYSLGGLLADEPGREGVASAVASMMTKGTAGRTAEQIAQQLEDLGASLGAACGNNSTFVRAQCLAEDWRTVLDLFADVAIGPTFPEDEWKKMQPRLAAAVRRQKDRWGGELGIAFRDAYFSDKHPWSQTRIGRAEVIEALTSKDLRDYHASHLGAAQTVLAVFGDVEPEQVAQAVNELFKQIPVKRQTPFDPPLPPAPVQGMHQVLTSKPLAAVQIGYGPCATRRSPDYPALQVLKTVLSDFPSGWLEGQLRGSAGDGLAYAVWSYQFTGLVPGAFVIGFNTSPPDLAEALKRAESVVNRARETLVDDQTLQRAKASVLVNEFMSKQSNGDRATEAALNELYGLGLDESERFMEEVKLLTAQQLQFAARMYLQNGVTVILTNEPMKPATSQAASEE